jgi:hypothetical protein
MVVSMSGAGNCYDNSAMESFFHTLKTEHTYFEHYDTREQAKKSIFEYVEVFYNRKRLHSTLGYCSPVTFEKTRDPGYRINKVNYGAIARPYLRGEVGRNAGLLFDFLAKRLPRKYRILSCFLYNSLSLPDHCRLLSVNFI